MQLVNSHVTVHSRTDFVDHENAAEKRLLWRLWLATPDGERLPESWRPAYGAVEPGTVRGGIRGQAYDDCAEVLRIAPGRRRGDDRSRRNDYVTWRSVAAALALSVFRRSTRAEQLPIPRPIRFIVPLSARAAAPTRWRASSRGASVTARAADRHRQPRRRERHHRHPARRESRARRLHHGARRAGEPRGESQRLPRPRLRSHPGFLGGEPAHAERLRADGAPGRARKYRKGPRRPRAREAGAAQLRLVGQRQRGPSRAGAFQAHGQGRHRARALQRRRARAQRSARRPDPGDGRAHGVRAAARACRQAAGDRSHDVEAHLGAARRARGFGDAAGLRKQRLVRRARCPGARPRP